MTDREKLIELIDEAEEWADHRCDELECEKCPAYKMKGSCMNQLMVQWLIEKGVTVQRWIPVTERLPEEREECDEGEKHMVSDIVQVSVQDSLGNRFVSDDMLFDGRWVNYPWGDFEITHWKPLPEPAKEGE